MYVCMYLVQTSATKVALCVERWHVLRMVIHRVGWHTGAHGRPTVRGAGGGVVIVRHVYVWWWGRLLFELANGPFVLPNLFNLPSRTQYILWKGKKTHCKRETHRYIRCEFIACVFLKEDFNRRLNCYCYYHCSKSCYNDYYYSHNHHSHYYSHHHY